MHCHPISLVRIYTAFQSWVVIKTVVVTVIAIAITISAVYAIFTHIIAVEKMHFKSRLRIN